LKNKKKSCKIAAASVRSRTHIWTSCCYCTLLK